MNDAAARLWAVSEFGGLRFGDKRRDRRAAKIAEVAARNPALSLPKMFPEWADLKAAYDFFASPHVTRRELMRGHVEKTVEQCRGRKRVLLIADTTFLSYGGWARLESGELGPVDAGRDTAGLVVHTGLAAADSGEVLGLLHQEVWTRKQPSRAGEGRAARLHRERESEKWAKTQTGAALALALAALGDEAPHVISIGDRESDIFSVLATATELGQGFVIRASQDRAVAEEDDPEFKPLSEALLDAPILGTRMIAVPRRPRKPPRTARLTIRATTVDFQSPRVISRMEPPLVVGVVSAVEETPPPGEEPLVWTLLTSLPVASLGEVEEVLRLYELRWLIEEFHMGLKTGCSIEKREVQTFHALENLLAMFSAIAVQLLRLRDAARQKPSVKAEAVLGTTLLTVLLAHRPKLAPTCSAYEALRAIANLGGFLGRKSDGEPGWRTLWSGYVQLQLLAQGWELAKRSR